MGLASAVKAWGLQMADAYNLANQPWHKFDRPFLPKAYKTLEEIEAECFEDLKLFWNADNTILRNRIPTSGPDDMGDQAIWHGIYTAMIVAKWRIRPTPELYLMLTQCAEGLKKHQTIHYEQKPRLIRGYDARSGRWQDDPSNDSLTGHFFGIYALLKWGPSELNYVAQQLLYGICAELYTNQGCLVNANGKPSTHGKLINGLLTDPLQYTLVHAIFTAAENLVDGMHDLFSLARSRWYREYMELIPYGKAALGTKENWNDEHRAAIHLLVIALEDKSPRAQEQCTKGFLRLFKYMERRANPWVNALIYLGLQPKAYDFGIYAKCNVDAKIVLGEFDLESKRYERPVDNRDMTFVSGVDPMTGWVAEWQTVGSKPRSFQPIPLYAMGAQDFFFQRHRFSLVDWTNFKESTSRYNGGDFLAAYWFSKLAGLL